MTRALIMVALVGVVFLACTQTALSQIPQTFSQKQILTCDHTGQPSCYSTGYAAGLVNRGIDCSALLLKLSGNSTQVADYCSGNRAAQQQLQQQH
ncbi:MAG TPA: hypothetical protein VEL11_13160 [Candidatus Bathyarchaeia archaeon]|nr:hypothetical protein [Candidatus Bathyarchaeia archaeon]